MSGLQLPPWWDGGNTGRRWRWGQSIVVLPPQETVENPRGRVIWPVWQQQIAIPVRVADVLVRPSAPTPPALIRDERPPAIDVEPKRWYDPVKVWLGAGWLWLVAALAATLYVAWQKPNITINVPSAPVVPLVAAAPPLPAAAPTVLPPAVPHAPTAVTLGTPRAKEGWIWSEYNPQRDPTELYGLNLWTHLTAALGAWLQWATYESNGAEYAKSIKPDNPSGLAITLLLPNGMTGTELLNVYSLIPKKSLQAFIDNALDVQQKAQVLAWLSKYEVLATTSLPKDIETSVLAAKQAVKKSTDGYITEPGVTLIVKYASPPITALHARSYLFQKAYGSDLEKIKKSIAELRTMLEKK